MPRPPKQCAHCGGDFRSSRAGVWSVYCSPRCRVLAFRARNTADDSDPGGDRKHRPRGDLYPTDPRNNHYRRKAVENGRLVMRRGFATGGAVRVRCQRRGCGREVEWTKGRPPKFCSSACRLAAFRQRKAAEEIHQRLKKAYEKIRGDAR